MDFERVSAELVPIPANPVEVHTAQDVQVSEEALQLVLESWAPNTRRAYASDWRRFETWCVQEGRTAMPATAETILEHVRYLHGRGLAPSTVDRAMRSVKAVHAHPLLSGGRGYLLDTSAAQRALRTIRREWSQSGGRVQRATPAVVEVLKRMIDVTGDDLRGLRDRMILTVGFVGMYRRSELASLLITDVHENPHGLDLFLSSSKTDKDSQGVKTAIPWGKNPQTCPVTLTRAWVEELERRGITQGPLIRQIHKDGGVRGGVSGRTIANILQDLADRAGLKGIQGHSLRAGGATTLGNQGVSQGIIAELGRWDPKSGVVAMYVRGVNPKQHPMSESGL